MKWRVEDVPSHRTKRGNIWDAMIPADLIRVMRGRPGVTFLLLDDDGNPLTVARADYNALIGAKKKPFRVQSRIIPRRTDGARHVWVSMDPGHWEHQAKLRGKGKAA